MLTISCHYAVDAHGGASQQLPAQQPARNVTATATAQATTNATANATAALGQRDQFQQHFGDDLHDEEGRGDYVDDLSRLMLDEDELSFASQLIAFRS